MPTDGVLVGECPRWDGQENTMFADPLFCDPENNDFRLAAGSPALTHPAGQIGALGQGCAAP